MKAGNIKEHRFMKKYLRTISLLALAPLLYPFSPAFATIVQSINYQGFLLSKITNLPVETPQDIKFVIYDSASAGTARFTESRCNVKVSKGRYDVEIGTGAAGGLPASLFTDYSGLWLEIQVDGDGDCSGAYEAMSPRIKLQASPYAFNSLYASTASAATPVFKADVIEALPQTTYGAITISTNLFVQGGISVGDITPGQKLSVAGMVESKGTYPACADPLNYTCGFKFPDGSVQTKAAALTMWDVSGDNLHTINPGNTGIGDTGLGQPLLIPSARLHVSSGAAASGDMFLITTGVTERFRINSAGEVYGGSYYGDGTTLTGIVRKAGDTMTGHLLISGSSLTVTSALGVSSPKLKLLDNVEISSAPAALYGGVRVSTHIYLTGPAIYYGDGSGLSNVTSLPDSTKVLKAGDIMSGPLSGITSLTAASATVTGSAFSVSGSTTFLVLNGNTSIGRLSVTRDITGSTITVTGGINAPGGVISGMQADIAQGVRASSAAFWGYNGPDPANTFSITTASGIRVSTGVVLSLGGFIGDGSQLTNVTGTDPNRLLKAGDTMNGHLLIYNSSFTIHPNDQNPYALRVLNPAEDTNYILAVTTGGIPGVNGMTEGRVGIMLPNLAVPSAPLEVNREALVSNSVGPAKLHIKSNLTGNYVHWSDSSNSSFGANLGILGFPTPVTSVDLVYRALGSDPYTGGAEVFRISVPSPDLSTYDANNWLFGLGTASPQERFHVATNMLVSTSSLNPILYVSTTSGRVSINTTAQTHSLTVNGGIAVTGQGSFYGNGNGITSLSAGALPATVALGSITAVSGGAYDGVVFSTTIYATSKLAAGGLFEPLAELHVRGTTRLDENGGDVILDLHPGFPADSYVRWTEAVGFGVPVGVLGFETSANPDLVYRAGGTNMDDGTQAYRIKPAGEFIVGSAGSGVGVDSAFVPAARFHVLNNMMVSAPGGNAVLFVSTGSGFVGISTGTPKERMHVASNFLVGADRASAALFVSTASGYVGISTGSPQGKLDVNGLGVFRSSLTVLGTGLSGTQSALEVIGSTLVVRNDGRVGIGLAAPNERLEVAGKVKATGFAASRARTTNICAGSISCTATCGAGKLLMGGGCSDSTGQSLVNSYPSSDTVWTCAYALSTDITAYAICSTVE